MTSDADDDLPKDPQVIVPEILVRPDSAQDKKSKEEDRAFKEGTLKESSSLQQARDELMQEEESRNHKRRHNLLDVAGTIGKCALWFLAVILGIMLLIWVLHVTLPACQRWLLPSEVDKLKDILFSGALSSALTLYGTSIAKQKK